VFSLPFIWFLFGECDLPGAALAAALAAIFHFCASGMCPGSALAVELIVLSLLPILIGIEEWPLPVAALAAMVHFCACAISQGSWLSREIPLVVLAIGVLVAWWADQRWPPNPNLGVVEAFYRKVTKPMRKRSSTKGFRPLT
jgi:hypothetical protein